MQFRHLSIAKPLAHRHSYARMRTPVLHQFVCELTRTRTRTHPTTPTHTRTRACVSGIFLVVMNTGNGVEELTSTKCTIINTSVTAGSNIDVLKSSPRAQSNAFSPESVEAFLACPHGIVVRTPPPALSHCHTQYLAPINIILFVTVCCNFSLVRTYPRLTFTTTTCRRKHAR
jgi:hypothetical protein